MMYLFLRNKNPEDFFMDENTKIIELKKTILSDNDSDAEDLRAFLREKKIFYINLMSSPGSGKTTTLLSLIPVLTEKYKRKVFVMEADIDSDVDMKTILSSGTHAVQLHTGGMCHLDAEMSRQGLLALTKNEDYDELFGSIVFLENVGNLVCPAEFDTGAHLDLVILSVPEGDDKPLKYPLVFEKTDAVLINKIDAESAFDFSRERVLENIRKRNEKEEVFFISAKTGEGIEKAAQFISKEAGKVLDQ